MATITLTKYLSVTKINKKTSSYVRELDLCQGDIVQVILEVESTKNAHEVLLKNWRNYHFKRATLNQFARFMGSGTIEYVEKETLV